MRKGQITVFIILGLVLFITFLLLFFLSSHFSKAKLQKGAEEAIEDSIKNSGVDAYVELCLKKITSNGLLLMGKQGGYLYAPPLQNGTIDPLSVSTVPMGGTFIDHGILFPPAQANYPDAPDYPIKNTRLFGSPLIPNGLEWLGLPWGYFGQKHLPALCETGGANDVPRSTDLIAPCNKGFYGTNSLQWQLERFVEKELEECIDRERLQIGSEVTIQHPKITIVLGENNLFVNASYPILINSSGVSSETIKHHINFHTFIPARLRKIYGLVDSLLQLDTFYANYAIMDHYQENKQWDNKIKIERLCPNCQLGEYSDVLVATDEASFIDSKPFVFQTAIQNRMPALEYLHVQSFPNAAGFVVDYLVLVTENARLTPEAIDPDEDSLTFSYEGWRETEGERFVGWNCCLADEHSYQECRDTLFRSCIVSDAAPSSPNRWSDSVLYKGPNYPFASITTDTKDIGFHTVTVKTQDDAGSEDYQEIGIFITPFPADVPGTGMQCGLQQGTNDPLSCVCVSGPCGGLTFEDLIVQGGICVGDAFCDTLCNIHTANDNQQACEKCLGGQYRAAGTDSVCCGSTQCVAAGVPGLFCLDQGGFNENKLCWNKNMIPCTATNKNCKYGSLFCTIDPVSGLPSWESGIPPGPPVGSCV